jgi:FkbM family methyltransferase
MAMSILHSAALVPILERSGFSAVLERLPTRLRRAAVRAIAPKGDYATVQTLARWAGIRDISVMGDYGLIQGALDDTAVLATYARTGTWRPAVAQFFNGFFQSHSRGIFVDIGANIGLTMVPIARHFGIRCFGFEPDPDNFRFLRNNVQSNCPPRNVELFELALFDSAGSFEFRRSDRNKGDHHLSRDGANAPPGEREAPVIRVPTARLDDVLSPYLADGAGPLAAKIVAQGAETQIVAGGERVLSGAGAVLIEIYPYGIERLQGDLMRLLGFCSRHFSRAVLNTGEHDDVLTWMPVDDITTQLRDRYEAATRLPGEYFHLFLKK